MDVLENQVMDFRMSLVMVCYSPDFVSAPIPGLGGGRGTGAPPCGAALSPAATCFDSVSPPLHPGEAEAGILGAAARQTAALLHLPGGQKVVCRGEGATPTPPGGHTGVSPCPHWFCSPPPPPSQLTFVDFLMFDVLDQNCIFAPRCLEPYSNLRAFMERFGVSVMGGGGEGGGGI